MSISICPACGFSAPDTDDPTHAYMSPSAACWAMYGEVLAREFSDADYYRSHRLLTDAYCAQHSIGPDRRARQSIHIHLAGLILHYHDGVSGPEIVRFLKTAARRSDFPRISAPAPDGSVTIEQIYAAGNADEHASAVDAYASKVLAFWEHEHPRIRALIEKVMQ